MNRRWFLGAIAAAPFVRPPVATTPVWPTTVVHYPMRVVYEQVIPNEWCLVRADLGDLSWFWREQ